MINRILLVFLVSIYFQPLNAQATKDVRAEANKLLRESRRLRVDGAYQASSIKLQRAIQLYQGLEMWGKFCTAKSLLAQNYELQGQMQQVEAIQEEIVLSSVKHLGKNNRFELQAYIKLGDLNYIKNDYAAALRYLGEAASLVKRKPAGNEDLKTEIYSLQAATLAASGQLPKALQAYQLAAQSADKKPAPELPVLARFHYGYAKALLENQQLDAALQQAQKSQALHQNLYARNNEKSIQATLLLVDILMEKEAPTKALVLTDQLISNLGNSVQKGTVEARLRKARLHLSLQQLSAAQAAIEIALATAQQLSQGQALLLTHCYRIQAKIAAQQEDWSKANTAFQKAIEVLYPFQRSNQKNCEELSIDPLLLLEITYEAQEIRYQQALKSQKQSDWQQAMNITENLNCINKQLSFEMDGTKNQQAIFSLQRRLAELNIANIYKFYQQQKKSELLTKLLKWIDYAKSWEYRQLLNFGAENWLNHTLSDSLWSDRISLQKKWFQLKNRILTSATSNQADLLRLWKEISQAKQNWIQQVKEKHGTYYQYFYQRSDFDVAAYRQQLSEGQAHLVCFQAEEQFYLLLVQKERLQALQIPAKELQTTIQQWSSKLLNPKLAKEASPLAQKIYQRVLAKWNLPKENCSLLYITTDQILDQLAFEALQTSENSYLIKHFPIQYLYQPSELLQSANSETKDLLFINSSYASKPAKGKALTWYEQANDWSDRRTSNKYRRLFIGDYWLNYQVGADHLKTEEVANYSVLHIALYHAIAKEPIPENGWLMNYESDTVAALFSTLDMMNMNVRAGLVTLAIGNEDTTDFQQLREVAAALRFAGAQAVLWPRWEVDEFYNRFLIQTYYNKLAEGLSKAEALQQAQLHLLKKRRYKNPHYWANLRLQGTNATIQLQSKFRFPWLFVGIGVGIMVLIIGAWARWGRG